MSTAVHSFILFAALFAAQTTPNLSGSWAFDATGSTGQPAASGATFLVINQTADDVTFDYYGSSNIEGREPIQSTRVSTDGKSRPGNKIRTYVTYVRAYWQRKTLVVQTKNTLDPDGYQTFNTENRWTLANDEKTLTDESSDGTKTVYRRETPTPAH